MAAFEGGECSAKCPQLFAREDNIGMTRTVLKVMLAHTDIAKIRIERTRDLLRTRAPDVKRQVFHEDG